MWVDESDNRKATATATGEWDARGRTAEGFTYCCVRIEHDVAVECDRITHNVAGVFARPISKHQDAGRSIGC